MQKKCEIELLRAEEKKLTENEDEKEDTNMATLLYQGHGSCKLTLAGGEVVYVDPFAGEGYNEPANLILVTHQHPDHNKIDLPPHAANCVVYQNTDALKDGDYQTLDCCGLHIEATEAYNRNHDKNSCVGYLVSVEGKLVYFAGDTSKTEQMASMAERHIDYAFLPTDGVFNMGMKEAIECAKLIGAKHTIPYHMAPGKLFDAKRAAKFTPPGALILKPGERITL